MGCAPSLEDTIHGDGSARKKGGKKGKGKSAHKEKQGGKKSAFALSRDKFIGGEGALVQQFADKAGGLLLVFQPQKGDGITFVFKTHEGVLFTKEFDASQLKHAKDAAGISYGWSAVFKSLASDMQRGKGIIKLPTNPLASTANEAKFEFKVRTVSKEAAVGGQEFVIPLLRVPESASTIQKLVIAPLTRRVQRMHLNQQVSRDFQLVHLETGVAVAQGGIVTAEQRVKKATKSMAALKEKVTTMQTRVRTGQEKIAKLEAKRNRLEHNQYHSRKEQSGRHWLDQLYEVGGAMYFAHSGYAVPHHPVEAIVRTDQIQALYSYMQANNSGSAGESNSLGLLRPMAQLPSISEIARNSNPSDPQAAAMTERLLRAIQFLDEWDYNVFEMDEATGGNALFFTTYALLHKLDLIQAFGIDEVVLRRFLIAVQAGYHPNPYHNSTHAADVAQVLYYLVFRSGFQDVCPLVQCTQLACILAGVIHDYDHPGFNNNFHTRTNAYLSTLYNDRSILENHHLACVFEMLRNPLFDIFANCDEDDRREIREVMIEMVLATDMGIHGKMIVSFQNRIKGGAQWGNLKTDLRLLLSMCIKAADTSNCCRPNHLYTAWAKNIAAEFYDQGDVEGRIKLGISPFMDRSKHLQDFAKGQQSFMNFVIIPMYETLVEVLPNMDFAVNLAKDNKEYWQTHTPGDLGPLRSKRRRGTVTSDRGSNDESRSTSTNGSMVDGGK